MWAEGIYQSDGRSTSWVKIKDPSYSQAERRAEFFDKRARAERARPAELKLA